MACKVGEVSTVLDFPFGVRSFYFVRYVIFLTAMLVGAVLQTALLDFSLRFSQIFT